MEIKKPSIIKKKKLKKTKIKHSPNKYIYGMGNFVANTLKKDNVTVIKHPAFNAGKPFILLLNHLSHRDFISAIATVYPARINFVVSSYYFGTKVRGTILKLMNAIPKLQLQSDPTAAKMMLTILRNGGAVGIYPEGQVAIDGHTRTLMTSTPKLLKMAKVDVFAGVVRGTYLRYPKWGKYPRKGPIEFELKLIAGANEISSLSDEELHNRIVNNLEHDDHEWAVKHNHIYTGKNLAEGLDGILYYCPSCHSNYTLKATGDKLSCKECHNTVRMDVYGGLVPDTIKDIAIPTVRQWRQKQMLAMAKDVFEDKKFPITEVAMSFCKGNKGKYDPAGKGVLTCDYSNVYYEGEMFGEKVKLTFAWKNLTGFSYTPMAEFEIASNQEIYSFTVPSDPVRCIEWVELGDVMMDNAEFRRALANEEKL